MKTLIFNGSPRVNGDTVSLLNVLTQSLNGSYKIIDCFYANISQCIDCRKCTEKPQCSINDDMQEIYKYIEECDNIVIASPIYFSELTGRLLDIASRLQLYFCANHFRSEALPVNSKKGVVILVGGGSGKPQKAYETAVCLLHLMNAFDIFPLICSHNTDLIPAIHDEAAVKAVISAAEFLNSRTQNS